MDPSNPSLHPVNLRSLNREHAPSPLQMPDPPLSLSIAPSRSLDLPAATPAGSAATQGNPITMPYIKRHVRRKLAQSKEACDKELKKVIHSITTYVEERIQELDYDDLSSAVVPSDAGSDDGGDEADIDLSVSSRHSRRTSTANSSPNSFRKHPTLPTRTHSGPSGSPYHELSPGKKGSGSRSGGSGAISRRLSRSVHASAIPISASSSRSNSRSRSPMPPVSTSYGDAGLGLSSSPRLTVANRRLSRYEAEEFVPSPPVDSFMTSLQEIISVATDVIEMPVSKLTSEPKSCAEIVQKAQTIGRAFDDHPEWQGKNWYVQLLLAVASLNRVVEWFEAERQFWNFEEDDGEDVSEPLTFVLKPQAHQTTDNRESIPHPPPEEHRPDTSRASSVREGKRPLREGSLKDAPMSPNQRGGDDASIRQTSEVPSELTRAEATETLRLQAEQAQSLNIVMELTLDGEHFGWINPAWIEVIGSDPDVLIGEPIAEHLAPTDSQVFADATRQLQEDDSHTLEVRFRVRCHPEDVDDDSEWYREMEGKGMLMYDRIEGTPSHTMWVLKPVGPAEPLNGRANIHDRRRLGGELVTPFPVWKDIPTGTILCRICECEIPSWYFVKHNDTCNESHRIEASVAECNESIAELRNTVRDLKAALERPNPGAIPDYRGTPIFSPTIATPTSAFAQIFKPPLSARLQKASLRKLQNKLLTQIEDVLQVAQEISMPSLKEEQAAVPIERQRLLSPESLDRISRAIGWTKPTSDDPALAQLVQDASMLVRSKIEEVNRLQNTIRYAEKVRQEWEDDYLARQAAMEAAVAASREKMSALSVTTGSDRGDHSSTTSEYAFEGDTSDSYSFPTPVRTSSPIPGRGRGSWRSPLAPMAHLTSHHHLANTRSPTPPSISSPLALAAPIVASSPDTSDDLHSQLGNPQPTKNRISSSNSNLEPRLLVTPPISPLITPLDVRSSRRLSLHPILSPTPSSSGASPAPLSPRTSLAPSRTTPSSIKDFDIIKPISKGAFGSVFLAKKKVTGDYYAIKVLRKADMIAKNQITNVKAERMILMKQAESPYVVKLFYTFQSKDNLYLVMEYLNGGDCAALIKTIGALPEEWTKGYVAEVVLGLEYLHTRGIVHRDLKPDNLLIDQHGHLKLTDFGLSRIGLLNRQTGDSRNGPVTMLGAERGKHDKPNTPSPRSTSADVTQPPSPLISASDSSAPGSFSHSYFNTRSGPTSLLFNGRDDISESSGSESISSMFWKRTPAHKRTTPKESPVQSFSDLTNDLRSHSNAIHAHRSGSGTPPTQPRFVGTPDYLAPEVILGFGGEDRAVDWWALGVITYEFLYGIPPFHDETPEKVFENIISRKIDWHEEWVDFSDDARDFMERLMGMDPTKRLGYNGADEVKQHPFLLDVEWDKVTSTEAQFVPQVTDPESTDYFDPRGAIPQLFHDDDAVAVTGRPSPIDAPDDGILQPSAIPASSPHGHVLHSDEDFGTFNFKNLPVLKQANDELIRKMHASPPQEAIPSPSSIPLLQTLSEPAVVIDRRRSISQRGPRVHTSQAPPDPRVSPQAIPILPPSPSTSTSSMGSALSRTTSNPVGAVHATHHNRRPSEFGPVERFKHNYLDHEGHRRNSMPSRLRTSSMSSQDFASMLPENWPPQERPSPVEVGTPLSSLGSGDIRKHQDAHGMDRVVTCLLAEDNPISIKILETLLTRMGCHCVLVADGAEAISVALGDIKFDMILMDLNMPNVDGDTAARYIKSTNNKNATTPIIAVSAYSMLESEAENNTFVASVAKPVQKADLLAVMKQLGFRISTREGAKHPNKVILPQSNTR